MATSSLDQISNGDVQKRRSVQGSGYSPNMSKVHLGGSAESDAESGSDEDDNSASEGRSSTTNEADVFALSDADAMNGDQRLAGLPAGEMFMEEALQAGTGVEDEVTPDSDYAGVENISDDEDSVGDLHDGSLLRAAEQDLIDEFEETEQRRNANAVAEDMNDMLIQDDEALARRLSLHSNESLSDFPALTGVDMNDDPFLGLSQNDGLYKEMWDDAEESLGLWRLPNTERTRQGSQDSNSTNKKRVRFEDVEQTFSRSSSMSSEDEDAGQAFPDLFAEHDDPAIRHQFALDIDPDATFQYDLDDAASFYDFDGEEERLALELDEEDSQEDDVDSSESGDDGDTTDEESPEEQIARFRKMKKATDKSPKLAPTTPKRAVPALGRATTEALLAARSGGKAPRLGTFILDKSRAAMSADGKQINVIPPTNPSAKDKAFWDRARIAARSTSTPPRSGAYWSMRSINKDEMPERPFTAQSTLGSMFNGNLDILRNNDVSGLGPEMFPEFLPRAATAVPSTTMDDSESEDIDIDMQEFLDIDDSGSESDALQSTPVMSPGQSDIFESFTSLGASRNESATGLLDHLDQHRGLVGSFRRNQTQVKHVSSLASNAAKRASTSEYNALQKGRRAAANTPMTPARRNRTSQDMSLTGAGVRKFVSSPLASRRPPSRGGSQSGINQTLSPSIMK